MICEACKQDKETTKKREAVGYMGPQEIFKNLCDDCIYTSKIYHCLPKANVRSIVLWRVVEQTREVI